MLTEFIAKQLKKAKYQLLKDGTYFGEVTGLQGIWSNAATLEDCRQELQGVLEDWLVLKIRSHERVPGLVMKIGQRTLVR